MIRTLDSDSLPRHKKGSNTRRNVSIKSRYLFYVRTAGRLPFIPWTSAPFIGIGFGGLFCLSPPDIMLAAPFDWKGATNFGETGGRGPPG